MSLQETEIGALIGIYVGQAGSSNPLTRIISSRTGGGKLSFKVPEKFEDVANNSVQNSRATLSCNLAFYMDDLIGSIDQLVSLAMGNLPSAVAGAGDAPSQFETLSVFLQHPDGYNGDFSIWIPICYSTKTLNEDWEKEKASEIPIVFTMSGRNRFSFDGTNQPFYQKDNVTLSGLMGSSYPLAY